MPKGEHTIVQTSLTPDEIQEVLSPVLAGATIEELRTSTLDNDCEFAFVASQFGGVALRRSPFGPGNAAAQVIVEDHGEKRNIELIAIRDTFLEGLNRQRGAADAFEGLSVMKQSPKLRAGRNMVQAMLQALQSADGHLERISG